MNVVLYSRVSTADQSVVAQLIELRQVAAQKGWTVLAEYEDVISGTKAARPALDALLARVAAGGVEAVVSVKIDRLGRSLLNFVALADRLRRAGCGIVCTSQGIDTTRQNACGELLTNLLVCMAQFERSLIVDRTKAGLVAARARGKVLGKPSARLVAEPARSEIVARWKADGRKGGVRGLAVRLGGCSPTTAARLAQSA